jgi:hypothetical protein
MAHNASNNINFESNLVFRLMTDTFDAGSLHRAVPELLLGRYLSRWYSSFSGATKQTAKSSLQDRDLKPQ